MIEFKNLTYSYSRHSNPALDDINSTPGEGTWLLLGANGAGKTTLLHAAAGLLIPTEGEVLINGRNPAKRLPDTLRNVFIVTDDLQVPMPTINRFAEVHSPFYPSFDATAFKNNLDAFGMTGNEKLRSLSMGTRKKAILAYSLALKTPVLLLDEPANGLDIIARKTLRRLMSANSFEGQTVVVSTHSAADLEPLYDGVMVLSQGRCILTLDTLSLLASLSFTADTQAPADALYFENDLGRYRAITPNTTGEPATDIDFALLYSALMSPAAPALLQTLNNIRK